MNVATHERLANLREFEHGLAGVLGRLVADPSRWIVIAEVARSENRYVQFLATESGTLVTEVVSNTNLSDAEALGLDAVATLRAAGWQDPVLPDHPNWWLRQQSSDVDVEAVVGKVIDALRRVFGLADTDLLRIKMFRSERPRSGGTSGT